MSKKYHHRYQRYALYIESEVMEDLRRRFGWKTPEVVRTLIKKYLEKLDKINEEEEKQRQKYLKTGNKYKL